MTDTEITSLYPFQDELPCLKADQRLTHELNAPFDKRDSFIQGELTNVKPEFNATVSSPCPSLSTIASSPSMRTSRVSLPSIWSNNSSDSSMLDSSCLSSAAPLWSYSFCDIPLSPTETTCGFQTTSQSLRNIWGSPAENHHQRRMSLSDDRLLPETHSAERNSDQMNGYGRRHSVAGPFMPKTPTRWMQDYRSPYPNDASMKPIDEDEMNTHYSRYQQHILNKGILDHIDEYFGGNNKDASAAPQVRNMTPTLPPQTAPPDPGFGKTMTAGGDAITFGSSELLMGKGIPLHHFLDSNTLLYLVKFKTNRTDICYIMQGDAILPQMGDLVITEADRGRDLGRVINILTANMIIQQQQKQLLDGTLSMDDDDANDEGRFDEPVSQQKCQVKRLYRLANAEETASLTTKQLDEEKALLICQAKIQQKKLPMQVVSAEYQWDRRKLTFYFMADQRIDFRELVRELFKTYKTRIWMCALKSNANNKLAGL